MSLNPFDKLEEKIDRLESLFLAATNKNINKDIVQTSPDFKFYPIINLFEQKICSKPTFYKYLKEGRYSLHKFGDRSFVDLEEFYSAFRKISFKEKKNVRSP